LQIWHLYEPVSFDLESGGSILDKANRWVGRATSLNDSPEQFKIHLLLGEPEDSRLQSTFVKAQNILMKMPGKKDFVRESEAETFACSRWIVDLLSGRPRRFTSLWIGTTTKVRLAVVPLSIGC
jgi:hypothetical protein